jgi:hypothetical protein
MQIKRGESDRQAGLSLNAKDLPYNRKGKREESIRKADEVVRARMRGDSITLLYAKGLWAWVVWGNREGRGDAVLRIGHERE